MSLYLLFLISYFRTQSRTHTLCPRACSTSTLIFGWHEKAGTATINNGVHKDRRGLYLFSPSFFYKYKPTPTITQTHTHAHTSIWLSCEPSYMYCLNIDVAQVVLESFVLLSRVCVGGFLTVCVSLFIT